MAEGWAEQAQDLTDAWIQAQTKLWSDWAASAVRLGATPLPGMGDWAQQWQEMARRTMSALTGQVDGVPGQVIERMFAGEEAFLGFLDMTLGMLRAVAPKIEVGDEWMELLRRFIDQIKEDTVQGRGAWMHAERLAAASGDVSELWRLYLAELERLYGPWVSAYRNAAIDLVEAVKGDRAAPRRMQAGFLDAYGATFGRVLAAPVVGFTRETSERLLRSFDAWVDVNRAGVDFQTEIVNTGFHALEALMRRLVEMSEQGEQITTLRQFYDLWLETAEKAYYELFGTDSFATIQGRFVNASMEYRRRQAELLDETMEAIGLPGRKEVDAVHRHVYDLRVEVRYMKREMAALRRELDARRASGDGGEHAGETGTPTGETATPADETATPAAKTPSRSARSTRGRVEAKTKTASPRSTKNTSRSRAKKGGATSSSRGTATG